MFYELLQQILSGNEAGKTELTVSIKTVFFQKGE
jgi:hypothetical protein